jgi:uncharacterized membrane protein
MNAFDIMSNLLVDGSGGAVLAMVGVTDTHKHCTQKTFFSFNKIGISSHQTLVLLLLFGILQGRRAVLVVLVFIDVRAGRATIVEIASCTVFAQA